MTVAILYLKNDVSQLSKIISKISSVITFSPSSKVEIEKNNLNIPIKSSLEFFDEDAQIQCQSTIEEACVSIERFCSQNEISNIEGELLKIHAMYFLTFLVRLEKIYDENEKYLIYLDTVWLEVKSYDEFVAICLKKIKLFTQIKKTAVFSNKIINYLNCYVSSVLKKNKQMDSVFICECDRGMSVIKNELSKTTKVFSIEVQANLIKSLYNLFKFRLNYFFDKNDIVIPVWVICNGNDVAQLDYRRIFNDKELSFLKLKEGYFLELFMNAEHVFELFMNVLNNTKPKKMILYDLIDAKNVILSSISNVLKIKSILISHAPNVQIANNNDEFIRKFIESRMCASNNVDQIVCQTPASEKLCEQLSPNINHVRYSPIIWGYKLSNDVITIGEENRVLYAGNYLEWGGNIPWIYETSEEAFESLQWILKSIAGLENVKFILKPKMNWIEKKELTPCELNYLNKKYKVNAEISTGSFEKEIKKATLVISHTSSVVFESLLARKPVMLFSYPCKYHYLKSIKTKSKRNAIYNVEKKEEFNDLMLKILNNHNNSLLTDEEISPYLWTNSSSNLENFNNIFN